jgi:hypothetical protein
MAFPEPYFNNSYGLGLEGFINYINIAVEGWLVNAFLAFAFIASVLVLSKSEWKMPGIVAFSSFVCLILAMIFKLFTMVNDYVIFFLVTLLAISVLWGILSKGER